MPRPDGGLITETNRQYYAGAQQFYISSAGAGKTFTSTFNTDLIFGSSDNASAQYGLNNFHVYSSPDALTLAFTLTAVVLELLGVNSVQVKASGLEYT